MKHIKEMIIDCPFCNDHEVSVEELLLHIAISKSRDIEILTLPLSLCPWAEKDIQESELMSAKTLIKNLHIRIYRIFDNNNEKNLRVVFKVEGELRVSDRLSIDVVIKLLDQLKITLLTHRIEISRKTNKKYKPAEQKAHEQLILRLLNKRFKPLYKSLRMLRSPLTE